jgi:sugar phosphate isomerase/epimerase
MNRRELLHSALGAAAGACGSILLPDSRGEEPGARPAANGLKSSDPPPVEDRLCIFTDFIDDFGYSYAEIAKLIKQLDIAGPDLTVRPGGVVPPEKVSEELPKAAAALRDAGLTIPMLSTGIVAADDAVTQATLTAMRDLKIGHYKLGYFHYGDLADWKKELAATAKSLAALVKLGEKFGVHAGFHNHSGANIGSAMWDSWEILQPLDARWIGLYYDPSHGTIEGGNHAWKLNLKRIAPRLTMVAVKDFVWEKADGRWRTRWVPLGEGMVDWPAFFALLKEIPFAGPLSLHIEYDPGGNTPMERFDNSLAAAKRDLDFLRMQLAAARDETPK